MNYAFDLLKEVLRRCKTLGAEHGFQFAVLVIPTSSQIADDLQMFSAPEVLKELQHNGVDISEKELDFKKPLSIVEHFCADLEIPSIDPTEDLRQIGAKAAIIPEDDHLSPAGHQVVATTLVERYDHEGRRFVH